MGISITTTRLAVAAALAASAFGCSGGDPGAEVVRTYDDGSQVTASAALEHELRMAAINMETAFTTDGVYRAEALPSADLYPMVDLKAVEATDAMFCVEGAIRDVRKHIRSGESSPTDGPC